MGLQRKSLMKRYSITIPRAVIAPCPPNPYNIIHGDFDDKTPRCNGDLTTPTFAVLHLEGSPTRNI